MYILKRTTADLIKILLAYLWQKCDSDFSQHLLSKDLLQHPLCASHGSGGIHNELDFVDSYIISTQTCLEAYKIYLFSFLSSQNVHI